MFNNYDVFRACVRFMCEIFDLKWKEDYAKILYAQAQLETGNFSSDIYRKGKNLFGMKNSKQRTKYWLGTYSNHATYSFGLLSIMDRMDWDKYHGIMFNDVKQYTEKVKLHSYAEDVVYVEKWLDIFSRLKV